MHRVSKLAATTVGALLALPAPAMAAGLSVETPALRVGTSLVGLIVAIVLLVEVLGVRRVSLGGAIAEKISYVVLAVLCLAASALAKWVGNFASQGITLEQTQLASELLVIVAMALFAAYFFSVSRAMSSYLKVMTSEQPADETPVTPDGGPRASSDSSVGADGASGV